MHEADPITQWIDQVKAGDRASIQHLWERYYHQMMRIAQQRLRNSPRGIADEEDVVQCAFASFFRAAEEGRFPQLTDRDSLWAHLFYYTLRKASHHIHRERAEKRGGGKVCTMSAVDCSDGELRLVSILHQEPDPAFTVLVAEQCQIMFDRLSDPRLRSVAQWKLEGYTNEEIAVKLKCVCRSVERMLNLIRKLWEAEVQP